MDQFLPLLFWFRSENYACQFSLTNFSIAPSVVPIGAVSIQVVQCTYLQVPAKYLHSKSGCTRIVGKADCTLKHNLFISMKLCLVSYSG